MIDVGETQLLDDVNPCARAHACIQAYLNVCVRESICKSLGCLCVGVCGLCDLKVHGRAEGLIGHACLCLLFIHVFIQSCE